MKSFLFARKLSDISYIFLLAFVFFLPFNHHLNRYILGLFFFTILVDKNFYLNYQFRSLSIYSKLILSFLLLLYILFCISLLHGGFLSEGINVLVHRLSFVFIPLVIFGYSLNPKKIKQVLFSFILGVFISSLACIIIILIERLKFTDAGLVFNYKVFVHDTSNFLESVLKRNNYLTYSYLSKFMHPSYFALYIFFSASILYYYLRNKFFKKQYVPYIILLLVYFFFFLLMLTVRASYICMLFFLVSIFIYEFFILKKRILGIILFLVISLASIYALKEKRVLNKIDEFTKLISSDTDPDTEYDARIYIWKGAVSAIEKNVLFGVGISNSKEVLKDTFLEQEFIEGNEIGFNSHNQFLDIWLETGLIGFILLLGIFVVGTIYSLKERSFILFFFLGIFFINLNFESMLNRFNGIIFFTIFISILIKNVRLIKVK